MYIGIAFPLHFGKEAIPKGGKLKWDKLDVTRSSAPQGSLLEPLLFCIFINDLPGVLKFSEPYIFADELKIFCVGKKREEV